MPILSTNGQRQTQSPSALRGALIGLIPLLLLAIIVIVTLLITTLARQWVASSGFFMQQQAALIVLIAGFILTILAFAIATWRVSEQIKDWQRDGLAMPVRAALWVLGITALVVVLPLVLALVLPQNPAP
jgi:hypothetical protein